MKFVVVSLFNSHAHSFICVEEKIFTSLIFLSMSGDVKPTEFQFLFDSPLDLFIDQEYLSTIQYCFMKNFDNFMLIFSTFDDYVCIYPRFHKKIDKSL